MFTYGAPIPQYGNELFGICLLSSDGEICGLYLSLHEVADIDGNDMTTLLIKETQ